jgi:hypothetical protein
VTIYKVREPPPELTVVHAAAGRNRHPPARAHGSIPPPARECRCQFFSSRFGLSIPFRGLCEEEGQLQFDERCDGTAGTILR